MLYTNAGIMLLTDKHINANEDVHVRCIDSSFFCSSANQNQRPRSPAEGGGGGGESINAKVMGLRYGSMW